MPVVARAKSSSDFARAPSAMARATGSLTAPCSAIVAGATPERRDFRLVRIGDVAREENGGRSGNIGQAMGQNPPGQDSATASVACLAVSRLTTTVSRFSLVMEKMETDSSARSLALLETSAEPINRRSTSPIRAQ